MDFGGCVLWGEDGALLHATVRGRLMGRRKSLGNAVVVGDEVLYQSAGGASPARVRGASEEAVVVTVEPRRNAFSRRAAGRLPAEQVVAANLDQVVIVASYAGPPFRYGFADRVFGQAEHAGIPARLVLNKIDLAGDPEDATRARAILEAYAAVGYPTHATSARTGEGLDDLRGACHGRRSLFVGHSGVGKSTLLNALVPGLDLLVGRVNEKTGKGRHTTTVACLLRLGPELELIDTPGLRAFGLWGIGPGDLEQAYREFRPHLGGCRFADCVHVHEPGCAVRAAVAEGAIPRARYESFLKLREEIARETTSGTARPRGLP